MKYLLIFLTFSLISPFSFCQEKTKESNYLEFGAMYFQRNGKSISYYLGYTFAGKKENTAWSNEVYLQSNRYNNLSGTTVTINFDHLSYGKAYNLHWNRLFVKPSLNIGAYYYDFRRYNGFQYNLGLNINPRLQAGIQTNKFRFSIMTDFTCGLSWFKFIKTDGSNPNSDLFFPYDLNLRWLTYLSISYKIN